VLFRSGECADPGTKPIYCEDPRLSFYAEGQSYRAICIKDKEITTLAKADLRLIIDFAASFLDLSTAERTTQGKKQTANDKAIDNLQSRKPNMEERLHGLISQL
jgi:hypothetical protein